jgi:uncharacterized protein (DUF427 family)
MSLTIGRGPFGQDPGGVFNFTREGPKHVLYFEDSPRRLRVVFNGQTIAQSDRMKLLHETGLTPVYYFPIEDVNMDFLEETDHQTHCPFKGDARYWSVVVGDERAENAVWSYPDPLEGAPPIKSYVAFYFERMDEWYEEEERIFVHPHDPYTRVDIRSSNRHVRVSFQGEVLAETDRPKLLFETGLPTRYYIPPPDVAKERLVASPKTTQCPYKGTANYYSVEGAGKQGEDLVWYYQQPLKEAEDIAGYLAFYNHRVDLEIDGVKQ